MQTQILSKMKILGKLWVWIFYTKGRRGVLKKWFFLIGRRAFLEHIENRLNPEDEPCTSKIEMAMFVGQGVIKS